MRRRLLLAGAAAWPALLEAIILGDDGAAHAEIVPGAGARP